MSETERHDSDMTFAPTGALGVFFRNDTLGGMVRELRPLVDGPAAWLVPAEASLVSRGPLWTPNADWYVIPGKFHRLRPATQTVYDDFIPTSPGYRPYGTTAVAWIANRGSAKVPVGSTYTFEQPIYLIDTTIISIHFLLRGVEGGSVLEPSVGLFNTPEKPNEWRYLPVVFGASLTWSVSLASIDFLDGFTITVRYAPLAPAGRNPTPPMSRLIYSVAGTYLSLVQWPLPVGQPDAGRRFDPPGRKSEASVIEIIHESM